MATVEREQWQQIDRRKDHIDGRQDAYEESSVLDLGTDRNDADRAHRSDLEINVGITKKHPKILGHRRRSNHVEQSLEGIRNPPPKRVGRQDQSPR